MSFFTFYLEKKFKFKWNNFPVRSATISVLLANIELFFTVKAKKFPEQTILSDFTTTF